MDGDTTTALAKRKPTNFEIELANYAPQIAAVLPSHIPLDRFKRIVITAVNLNPDLLSADRRSFFNSCIQCAKDGLLPDGREAALVIFRTKSKRTNEWEKKVQYMPMVQGIRKRMRYTGEVASAEAHVVCQNDRFSYRLGDDPKIEHEPALDRGAPVGAYAIIKLTNGEVIREVMSVAEIEKVRAVSKAKDDGPWSQWWGEMARKTVLRRASKAAPVASEVETLFRRDDALPAIEAPPEAPLVEAPPPRPRRADFAPQPRVTDVEEEPAGDVALEVAEQMKRDEESRPARSFTFRTSQRKTVTADSIGKWRDMLIAEATDPDRAATLRDLNAPILDDLRDEFPDHVAAVCRAFDERIAADFPGDR